MKVIHIAPNHVEVISTNREPEIRLFFSYETLVGMKHGDAVFVASQPYSRTTTKHLKEWVASLHTRPTVMSVAQEVLENMASVEVC